MNSARNPLNLLLLSTSVGALGSGLGGGVELTLRNIALELMRRGHSVDILAPVGSEMLGLAIAPICGKLHTTAQTQGRDASIEMPGDSVLANMWESARERQSKYDLLVNFAYDWLPFYLTSFLKTPIAHLVSMGSLTLAMDDVIGKAAAQFPGTIGVHSWAQAETFKFAADCRCLGNGIDLEAYDFCAEPENYLGWVGRIAPEKGIEDAIAAADRLTIPLKVWGAMPDLAYWDKICLTYPDAAFTYEGFLSTQDLQKALGRCRALLMTHKWVEAFGNVAIEALACGVPVISYKRGGPAEIVQNGVTGWLVEPDSLDGLVEAIARLPEIDRQACRQRAETEYSMQAMGDRVEAWFYDILEAKP